MEEFTDHITPPGETSAEALGRRQLLKVLAATGGAVAASSLLPGHWTRPVVEVGLLPVHAQASPTPTSGPALGTGDLQATLRWNTGNPSALNCAADGGASGGVDIDLHLVEPDGTRVFFGSPTGSTAELDIDNQTAFGPENIFVAPGQAATGTYRVQVVYFCGGVATTATISLRVFADTPQEQTATFTRNLTVVDTSTAINVADVTFPGGTIQEVSGSTPFSQSAAKD